MIFTLKKIITPVVIFLILIASSCAPKQELSSKKVPSGIIHPDSMVAILVDLQTAEARLRLLKRDGQNVDSLANKAIEMIFLKHKITRKDLAKSTDYYQENLETYEEIYSSVITRLTQLQTEINSSE